MKIPGEICLIRPINALVAGLAAILAYFIASGTLLPGTIILLAIVFLITAGGNTINDFFDVEIDHINRPDRPIPSGEVSKYHAGILALVLFACGILLSAFTNSLCFIIAVFNALLLVLYAARLKRKLFIGNMAVSYLTASIFLFGGAFYGIDGFEKISAIALMTFFAILSRELLKTAEDVEGDRAAGALTVPVVYGIRPTVFLALAFALCAVAVKLLSVPVVGESLSVGILIVDAIILLAATRTLGCLHPACVREKRASQLLKIGMFSSLIVFTLSSALL